MTITDDDARRAGYAARRRVGRRARPAVGRSAALPGRAARRRRRIRGSPERARDDLTADDVAELSRRLGRLDRASRIGPWTARCCALIGDATGCAGRRSRRRAGPGAARLQDRRPQAQGARTDREPDRRLPALAARPGLARALPAALIRGFRARPRFRAPVRYANPRRCAGGRRGDPSRGWCRAAKRRRRRGARWWPRSGPRGRPRSRRHEPGVGEHAQVLDDRLAGRREVLAERGRRLRAVVDEALEHGAPGRIGEDGEQLVERATPSSHEAEASAGQHEQQRPDVPGHARRRRRRRGQWRGTSR